MAQAPDYYSVLGLDPTADQAAVHATWKALLRRYHPDVNRGADVAARAKAINEAYSVLGKADARAAYDRSRLPPPPRPSSAQRTGPSAPGARRPARPRPSARPSDSYSAPRNAHDWATGLLLLLLTAAPLGVILVLYNEESGRTYPDRRPALVDRVPPLHDGKAPPPTFRFRHTAP